MVFRTDLAVEARELLEKDIGGTDYFTQRYGDVTPVSYTHLDVYKRHV